MQYKCTIGRDFHFFQSDIQMIVSNTLNYDELPALAADAMKAAGIQDYTIIHTDVVQTIMDLRTKTVLVFTMQDTYGQSFKMRLTQ